MANLDAIRSQARQVAWQYKDGNTRNYNPFARTAKGRKPSDDEELQRVQTESSVPLGPESERRARDQAEYPHPRHHNTAPEFGSATDEKPPPTILGSREDENSNGASKFSDNTDFASTSPQSTSDTIVADGATRGINSTDEDEGPKKRSRFKLFGRHKDEDTTNDGDSEKSKKKKKQRPKVKLTLWQQFRHTLFGSWINVLLVAVPIGIAINYAHLTGTARVSIFVVNFVAIIPLAAMLSYATEELAMYTGETLGGLLNATFGNATELIGK